MKDLPVNYQFKCSSETGLKAKLIKYTYGAVKFQKLTNQSYVIFSQRSRVLTRVLQPPHKFENFIVATFTLAQVGGFAQKLFWSSFVKICQCLGVAQ